MRASLERALIASFAPPNEDQIFDRSRRQIRFGQYRRMLSYVVQNCKSRQRRAENMGFIAKVSLPSEGSFAAETYPLSPSLLPRGEKVRCTSRDLPQLDLVFDLMGEVDAAEGENNFGRQFFVALEAAGFHGVAHRLFDFALRGDADLLEEFAQAGVENIFVHENLLELRVVRVVQHVVAEIALTAVGARVGVVAHDIAVLAAGYILRRAGRDVVGAAKCIVVAA